MSLSVTAIYPLNVPIYQHGNCNVVNVILISTIDVGRSRGMSSAKQKMPTLPKHAIAHSRLALGPCPSSFLFRPVKFLFMDCKICHCDIGFPAYYFRFLKRV